MLRERGSPGCSASILQSNFHITSSKIDSALRAADGRIHCQPYNSGAVRLVRRKNQPCCSQMSSACRAVTLLCYPTICFAGFMHNQDQHEITQNSQSPIVHRVLGLSLSFFVWYYELQAVVFLRSRLLDWWRLGSRPVWLVKRTPTLSTPACPDREEPIIDHCGG